jgi:hypothetical protein
MIMILYMNIKDLSGSRATANISRRSTGWRVNKAGDMAGCLCLAPRKASVLGQKLYER